MCAWLLQPQRGGDADLCVLPPTLYVCVCVCARRRRSWVDALQWERSGEWPAVAPVEWEVTGAKAGTVRELGTLSFVRVYQAVSDCACACVYVRVYVGSCPPKYR